VIIANMSTTPPIDKKFDDENVERLDKESTNNVALPASLTDMSAEEINRLEKKLVRKIDVTLLPILMVM
jgi:hypothetical protein